MEFTAQEQADLTAHEKILASLLRTADEFLPQHPEQELCPRQAALLERLEAAFAGNQTLEYAERHGIPY